MKRLIFILLISSTMPACAHAQNNGKEKISFATTFGTVITMDTPSETPFTWQVLAYYNLTERWALGVGTGISFYEKMLIPIYGDVKFQIGRKRKFTPYAEFAMGHSFAPANDANGGFFMNPSIGIQYSVRKKTKLRLAVGYEWQDLKRRKEHADRYFYKEFEEQLGHHGISIKLGLCF